MGTTTDSIRFVPEGGVRTPHGCGVYTGRFDPIVKTPEGYSKFVYIKVDKGHVDMFGRLYPRKIGVWVHHFDDFGVLVEGTYEAFLAKRALQKAGYDPETDIWGWRIVRLEEPDGRGRTAVAFYFDAEAGLP